MLVTIDVGNTNVVFGVFLPGSDDPLDHWRAATVRQRTSDEWLLLLQQFLAMRNIDLSDVTGIALCSVVPAVTTAMRRMGERVGIEPFVVNWQTDTGMPILMDDPREVGADRIANAIGGYAFAKSSLIVVDLGTATTFDVVSAKGEYLGGVILPGIEISLGALFERAAALSRIELIVPASVVGKNTASAVQSGATYGYASQVDGVCKRIKNEVGQSTVISTGGLSPLISDLSSEIEHHDPWLTLRGLRLIYERQYEK